MAWCTVSVTAEEAAKQFPALQPGSFFALELGQLQQKGSWKGFWKERRDTHATVMQHVDGTIDVSVQLKKMPTTSTVVALISGQEGVVIPSDVLLRQGVPTGDLGLNQTVVDPDEAAHKKILHETFRKEPNVALRGVIMVGIPLARTGVAYAMGGPALAVMVNIPPVMNWVTARAMRSFEKSLQNVETSTAQTVTEGQPPQQ